MKRILLLILLLAVLLLCGCTAFLQVKPTQISSPEQLTPSTESTEPPPELQPAALVGTWQSTYSEVEGDRRENTAITLVILGDFGGNLTMTYTDREFTPNNLQDLPLTVMKGEMYYGCENGNWYAETPLIGLDIYRVTLLDENTLLLQCYFEVDGHPMVSYLWFVRK